ncbi:MAG TPA: hypothetical protein VIE65_10340 [Methylobacter sp.]
MFKQYQSEIVQSEKVVGLQCKYSSKARSCQIDLLECVMQVAHAQMQIHTGRTMLNGGGDQFRSPTHAPLCDIEHGQFQIGLLEAWRTFHRVAEVCFSGDRILFIAGYASQQEMRIRNPWINGKCADQCASCFNQPALFMQCKTEIVERTGVFRSNGDGLPIACFRRFELSSTKQCVADLLEFRILADCHLQHL